MVKNDHFWWKKHSLGFWDYAPFSLLSIILASFLPFSKKYSNSQQISMFLNPLCTTLSVQNISKKYEKRVNFYVWSIGKVPDFKYFYNLQNMSRKGVYFSHKIGLFKQISMFFYLIFGPFLNNWEQKCCRFIK